MTASRKSHGRCPQSLGGRCADRRSRRLRQKSSAAVAGVGESTGTLGCCRREDGQVPRSYRVITYGCQMNTHDSERISGLLEHAGYVRAEADDADVVVFNTCAVRE